MTVTTDFSAAHAALARALDEREYRQATPVQKAVLQEDARERDLLVSAQTGSGKTIAFGLAIAERLLEAADRMGPAGAPQALIIAPTRELALQVQRELGWLYQYTGARIVSCVGGMDPGRERRELSAGAHIIVGTPGRLRDHLERGALKVSALKAVVLDEADEMLDMGFREDLEFILETTPPERQTLLFSATLPKTIVNMARHYQRDALRIEALGESKGHADIEYRAVRVAGHRMEAAVVNFLRFLDPPAALVFCGTRERVRHMEAVLSERGFAAVSLSGELSQHERNHALQALRDGRARVCVATDVAARGIDLPSLNLVIHADLPNDAEVLQHRSGRTGRAGKKGISVLLVPPSRRRRAEDMLGRARVNAVWGNPPTADEIRVLDRERLLNDPLLSETPGDEDYALGDTLLEKHGVREIAAALSRVMRAKLPLPEEIEEETPYKSSASRQDKPARGPKPDWKERPQDGPRAERPAHKGPRAERPARLAHDDAPRPRSGADMSDGVWFRLNVGRERKADPKWLLPEICRQGDITKADVGPIRVEEMQTLFQISAGAAPAFAEKIAARTKGGVRITPYNHAADAAPAAPAAVQDAPRPAKKPFYKEGQKEGHKEGYRGKGGKPSFAKGGFKGAGKGGGPKTGGPKTGGKGGKSFKKWGKGPDAKPRKAPQG